MQTDPVPVVNHFSLMVYHCYQNAVQIGKLASLLAVTVTPQKDINTRASRRRGYFEIAEAAREWVLLKLAGFIINLMDLY